MLLQGESLPCLLNASSCVLNRAMWWEHGKMDREKMGPHMKSRAWIWKLTGNAKEEQGYKWNREGSIVSTFFGHWTKHAYNHGFPYKIIALGHEPVLWSQRDLGLYPGLLHIRLMTLILFLNLSKSLFLYYKTWMLMVSPSMGLLCG